MVDVRRDDLSRVIERALECSPGDQTEVAVMATDSYLTRFAANRIHQNVAERDATLSVKVVMGQRVGRATANSLSDETVRETVAAAASIARLQRPNPDFKGLPKAQPVRSVPAWDEATATCPAARRAHAVRTIIDTAAGEGFEAAGALSTAGYALAIGNSHGIMAYHPWTMARLSLVVMAGSESSGYAAQANTQLAELDPAAAAAEAVDRCRRGRGAVAVGPGEYEVILEPHAVVTLASFIGTLAFSAQSYQEGHSPLSPGVGPGGAGGGLGQQLVHPSINLWDDGLDVAGMPMPFDYEGVPKRRVDLFAGGVAKSLVYDTMTAGTDGRESTGHATSGGRGPMPQNMFMGTGDATVEEMIASTRRGLWITRFHYTNPVHPVKTIITGMTRDGTFLVENGRVISPVKNLRFTQSILGALGTVEAIGWRAELMAGGRGGGVSVPALKLGKFAFTGVTEF